jgi:hypothetical protein
MLYIKFRACAARAGAGARSLIALRPRLRVCQNDAAPCGFGSSKLVERLFTKAFILQVWPNLLNVNHIRTLTVYWIHVTESTKDDDPRRV